MIRLYNILLYTNNLNDIYVFVLKIKKTQVFNNNFIN